MKTVTALIALAAAACSTADSTSSPPNDAAAPPSGDAPGGCFVSLGFSPTQPVAGPAASITVRSHVVGAPGVLEYHWHVGFNGVTVNFTPQADSTEIAFLAPEPGVYQVDLEVTGSPTFCSSGSITINVRASGAQTERLRLHVVSPKSYSSFTRIAPSGNGASRFAYGSIASGFASTCTLWRS